MNQVPNGLQINPCTVAQQPVGVCAPQQAPQNPNYNAVKIDIHNPKVDTQAQPVVYNYPQQPVYQYPEAPVYTYPQCNAPVYMPQQPETTPVFQQPVPTATQTIPQVIQPVQPGQMQPINPVNPAAPVQTAPAIINQQNNNGPVAPQEPESAINVPQPQVVAPEQQVPQVDFNGFIAKLTNPDFEVQKQGMEEIAKVVNNAPEKATELVDTKIFDALNNIINADTSNIEGPTQEQIDARNKILENKEVTEEEKALANTSSQRELAERNKSFALFTTAILDKLYADEVEKLNNARDPLTELPGIDTMVNQVKDNPNPLVRASAIEALSYLECPDYKKDLETVFTVAKNDQDAGVVEAAKNALEKLSQIA